MMRGSDEPADPRDRAEQFDSFIREALEQKYLTVYGTTALLGVTDPNGKFHPHHPLVRWDLVTFVDNYLSGGVFEPRLLLSVVDCAIDLKLQLYYVMEVDVGTYNAAYHDRINARPELEGSPWMTLTRMSIDQTIIGKSRVLWERLMNLVYLMETGTRLEDRRSKKNKFFKMVRDTPRWRFLEPYQQVVTDYDDALRTPEFHKYSVLRKQVFGHDPVDPARVLELSNRMMNVIWESLLAILVGETPRSFSDLHLDPEGTGIDRHFLTGECGPTQDTDPREDV